MDRDTALSILNDIYGVFVGAGIALLLSRLEGPSFFDLFLVLVGFINVLSGIIFVLVLEYVVGMPTREPTWTQIILLGFFSVIFFTSLGLGGAYLLGWILFGIGTQYDLMRRIAAFNLLLQAGLVFWALSRVVVKVVTRALIIDVEVDKIKNRQEAP